jgi:hypothetical protein
LKLNSQQVVAGTPRSVKLTEELVFRSPSRMYLERTFEPELIGAIVCPTVRGYFEDRMIPAESNPLTHPGVSTFKIPPAMVKVKGESRSVRGMRVEVNEAFLDWGKNPRAMLYMDENIPGGIVRLELDTVMRGEPSNYYGVLVDYHGKLIDDQKQ